MKKIIGFTSIIFFLLMNQAYSRCLDNWQKIYSFPSEYIINDICFKTQDDGWAIGFKQIPGVGNGGVILATEDGGHTWVEQVVDSSYSCFNALCINSNNNKWAVGSSAHYKSINSGDWVSLPDSIFHVNEFWGLSDMYSVHFYDSLHGMIGGVAGFYTQTEDGGITWKSGNLNEFGIAVDTLQSIEMLSPDIILIACMGGIVISDDGGVSWSQSYSGYCNYHKFSFINDSTGWALSKENNVIHTTNSGKLWEDLGLAYSDFTMASDITFYNDKIGWICSYSGKIWKTVDGGHTWIPYTIDDVILKSISIVPTDQIGFIINEKNELYSAILDVSNVSDKKSELPEKVELCQCYPNPFNPFTNISYNINTYSYISLTIHDVWGREIKNLVGEFQSPGLYNIKFDAGNLTSGVYFYKLKVGNNFVKTKKMLLIR